MTRHAVGAVDEWRESECRLVRVGQVDIGVFFVGGEYRAYLNVCPHAGAPLCTGRSGGAEYEAGRELGSVRCPWHGWEFDLRTGAFLGNPRCTLDTYRVEVDEGIVWIWV